MPLRRGTTIFSRMIISFRSCFEMNQLKMYSTNITDNQWQVIEKNINVQERKKRHYLRGCGRGVRALARRMPDQISDASETMDYRALFLLARELPQTHHRLRISGRYRRDDGATRNSILFSHSG